MPLLDGLGGLRHRADDPDEGNALTRFQIDGVLGIDLHVLVEHREHRTLIPTADPQVAIGNALPNRHMLERGLPPNGIVGQHVRDGGERRRNAVWRRCTGRPDVTGAHRRRPDTPQRNHGERGHHQCRNPKLHYRAS